jgi:hypothetical protein
MQGTLDKRIEGNESSRVAAVNRSKRRYLQEFFGYNQGLKAWFY